MNEVIQELEANATNGRENFCYISENKLLAIKELSKRDYEEYKKITQAINKVKDYCITQIKNNEDLIERLEGTNSFRIGNAKSMITELNNILKIIEAVN